VVAFAYAVIRDAHDFAVDINVNVGIERVAEQATGVANAVADAVLGSAKISGCARGEIGLAIISASSHSDTQAEAEAAWLGIVGPQSTIATFCCVENPVATGGADVASATRCIKARAGGVAFQRTPSLKA